MFKNCVLIRTPPVLSGGNQILLTNILQLILQIHLQNWYNHTPSRITGSVGRSTTKKEKIVLKLEKSSKFPLTNK